MAMGSESYQWWSKAKLCLVKGLFEKEAAPMKKKLSVLDCGCARGKFLEMLSSNAFVADVKGIECSVEDIASAAPAVKSKIVEGDASDLSFLKDSFDFVFCLDFLEHVDDEKAVKSISARLEKGGKLIATVPAYQSLFSSHDREVSHLRRYSAKQLRRLLEGNGFRVKRIGYWNFFLFPLLALFRLKDKNAKGLRHAPAFLNTLLSAILKVENFFVLSGINFPWGLTVYCIAEKRK
ncbi:MAG: class I SAM-dependent methyltransferase [Candidatus Diapherotrites archaeon]